MSSGFARSLPCGVYDCKGTAHTHAKKERVRIGKAFLSPLQSEEHGDVDFYAGCVSTYYDSK